MKKIQKTVLQILIFTLLTVGILTVRPVSIRASVPERMADSSIRLLRESLRAAKSTENVLISPDSILTAMVMVENGAARGTLTEMEKAFA